MFRAEKLKALTEYLENCKEAFQAADKFKGQQSFLREIEKTGWKVRISQGKLNDEFPILIINPSHSPQFVNEINDFLKTPDAQGVLNKITYNQWDIQRLGKKEIDESIKFCDFYIKHCKNLLAEFENEKDVAAYTTTTPTANPTNPQPISQNSLEDMLMDPPSDDAFDTEEDNAHISENESGDSDYEEKANTPKTTRIERPSGDEGGLAGGTIGYDDFFAKGENSASLSSTSSGFPPGYTFTPPSDGIGGRAGLTVHSRWDSIPSLDPTPSFPETHQQPKPISSPDVNDDEGHLINKRQQKRRVSNKDATTQSTASRSTTTSEQSPAQFYVPNADTTTPAQPTGNLERGTGHPVEPFPQQTPQTIDNDEMFDDDDTPTLGNSYWGPTSAEPFSPFAFSNEQALGAEPYQRDTVRLEAPAPVKGFRPNQPWNDLLANVRNPDSEIRQEIFSSQKYQFCGVKPTQNTELASFKQIDRSGGPTGLEVQMGRQYASVTYPNSLDSSLVENALIDTLQGMKPSIGNGTLVIKPASLQSFLMQYDCIQRENIKFRLEAEPHVLREINNHYARKGKRVPQFVQQPQEALSYPTRVEQRREPTELRTEGQPPGPFMQPLHVPLAQPTRVEQHTNPPIRRETSNPELRTEKEPRTGQFRAR